MKPIWKKWLELNLISAEKYARLVRKDPLSEDEIGGFINRQLVFTNQSVKALVEVLQKTNPRATIIYSKAGNVSDFRHEFDLLKCRETNDFHHANDAFLNIVVGNTYHTKFGFDARAVIRQYKEDHISLSTKKIFFSNVPGAWNAQGQSLSTVKETLSLNDVIVTKMAKDGKGGFYDETIYPKNESLFPIRESLDDPRNDTTKYGGFKKPAISYFMIVRSIDQKNKPQWTIEGVPVIYSFRLKNDPSFMTWFLDNYLGLRQAEIVVPHIRINSLFRIGASYAYLSGKSGNTILLQNANQMFWKKSESDYVRVITKHQDKSVSKEGIDSFADPEYVLSESKKPEKHPLKITLADNLNLFDKIVNQLQKSIYSSLPVSKYVISLKEARNHFADLNVRKQALVLYEMLHLVQCNSTLSDLSLIMENARFLGVNRCNKNITGLDFSIIDHSVTGLYQSIRWRLKNAV
jgi:CRISPR-associated endonuclease Csn1